MRREKFRELCEDFWSNGHGDVVRLVLNAQGRRELADTMLVSRDSVRVVPVTPREKSIGAGISHVVNPVTCSEVEVIAVESGNWMEVRYPVI